MTPFILHIEYLLQRHDCVILPGLGALVVEHIPAHIDEDHFSILPPSKKIIFNPSILHDDGLLATSISRTEGCSFQQARLLLHNEITLIRKAIAEEGEFSLGNAGTLRFGHNAGKEESIVFIPTKTPLQKAAETGLYCAPMKREIPQTEATTEVMAATPTASKTGAQKSTEDTSLQSCPEGYTLKPFSDKNYYIAINKVFAKCAASIAIVLVVALSFIMPHKESANPPVKASMNPVETIYVETHADAERINQTSAPAQTQQPTAEVPAAASSETSAASADALTGSYLIVATFHTQKEAEKFINARRGGDYDLTVIKGKNVWRVSAGHGDKSTLRTILNSPEFRAAFTESWIWTAQ